MSFLNDYLVILALVIVPGPALALGLRPGLRSTYFYIQHFFLMLNILQIKTLSEFMSQF